MISNIYFQKYSEPLNTYVINLKIIRKHIQIIDQSTVSHIQISHILRYNLMSGYQHLIPMGKGSIHILTYNPMNGLTHISDQF